MYDDEMNRIDENDGTEYAGAEDSLDLEDAQAAPSGLEIAQEQAASAGDRPAVPEMSAGPVSGQSQPAVSENAQNYSDGGHGYGVSTGNGQTENSQSESGRNYGGSYAGGQSYRDLSGSNPSYGVQSGAGQGYSGQSYGGQDGAGQSYGSRDGSGQNSAGQGYSSQSGAGQAYGSRDGSGQNGTSQSYDSQNGASQGYNSQNGASQVYGSQNGTSQSYGSQNTTGQSYSSQNPYSGNGAQNYPGQYGYGANTQSHSGQYGASQGYGDASGNRSPYGSQYGANQNYSGQNPYGGNGGQNYQNGYNTQNHQDAYSQSYQNAGGSASNGQNQYSAGNSQNTDSPYPVNQEPKKKKAPGKVKKAAGLVAAALVFGVISGGTMVGINILADSMKEEDAPPITVNQPTEKYSLSDDDISRIAGSLNLNSDGSRTVVMDVSDIVEDVMPSVVAINNMTRYENINPWFGGSQTYEVPSAGSGIIVGQNDTDLLIVTNNHVVEDATETSVVFIDDTEVEATIKGTDSESDLAVVAVPLNTIPAETLEKISIAELGNSDELKVGQGVIAIGNALGYGQAVTVGYISALNREVTVDGSTSRNLLQTDAAINPGNSGGALLNMQGQVIGINEAKYTDTDVEGMGYAIPISQAQSVIDTLMVRRSGEQVEEDQAGYLGIQGITVDSTMEQQFGIPAGVYIVRIVEGGAASKTDLREKDVLVKFDGQTIRTYSSLQDLLKYYKKGETVEIVVKSLENGEYVERTITITLGGRETVNNG